MPTTNKYIHFARILIICLAVLHITPVTAEPTNTSAAIGKWFRYKTTTGATAITGQVSAEHMRLGYEVLDSNMRVIRVVPPYNANAYAAKKKQRDEQYARDQADIKLRKTFISSFRAKTQLAEMNKNFTNQLATANRQISALELQQQKLIANAAIFEQRGKAVPEKFKNNITTTRQKIAELRTSTITIQNEKLKTGTNYQNIITRLEMMEAKERTKLTASEGNAP